MYMCYGIIYIRFKSIQKDVSSAQQQPTHNFHFKWGFFLLKFILKIPMFYL